jgi:hypothetical protein
MSGIRFAFVTVALAAAAAFAEDTSKDESWQSVTFSFYTPKHAPTIRYASSR